MPQRPVLITLDNVTRFHGDRLILKQISASFTESSITLLAGENGAGKSTLLQIIAGLLTPSSGKVNYTNERQPSMALLGHQPAIYPNLTAWENLLFWGRLHHVSVSPSLLESLLERMRLAPFAHEKAKNFSRGMMQRLNLARIFLTKPHVILLDEPATGLDQPSTQLLYEEIQNAKNNGCCIIWISHFLEHDLSHADTILLLAEKKLFFSGSPTLFAQNFSLKTFQPLSHQEKSLESGITDYPEQVVTVSDRQKLSSGIRNLCNPSTNQTQKNVATECSVGKNVNPNEGMPQ